MIESGRAPAIELETLDGQTFSLAQQLLLGPVALVFFKISCPTCQYTLPFLDRLYASQTADTPFLIGISQDKADITREFALHFGLHFPILLDTALHDYAVSNAYKITNVPSLFLIEPSGEISWALSGFHKVELERLGQRYGRSPFEAGESVSALRPG